MDKKQAKFTYYTRTKFFSINEAEDFIHVLLTFGLSTCPELIVLSINTMRKIAPKYVRNLEALGIDIKQLWDEKELRFLKRKELIQKVGEEEFKVLETIGRTIREGRWREVKVKGLERTFKRKLGYIPDEVQQAIKGKRTIDGRLEHYFKRKYLPDEPIRPSKPADLDKWLLEVLADDKSVVLKSYGRYLISNGVFGAIIEPPNFRISCYGLRGDVEEWKQENYWDTELGTIGSLKKLLSGD